MEFRSTSGKAEGLGSAKEGTHHFWMQRLTAIGLIPLGLWFINSIVDIAPAERGMIVAWMQQPWNTILMTLFLLSGIYHGTIGMQVVIEDYVHAKLPKYTLLIGLKLVMALFLAMAVYAIAKIAFGRM